jgi:1-acyl-sn-glycerol-3-phosphate acyltransferase
MRAWSYEPSPAIAQRPGEQLTVFPRERDMTHALLRILWTLWLRLFLRVYFRLRVMGRERLPKTGSCVLVSNHASHLDAVALSTVIPLRLVERTFAAAAKDYFFSSFWRSFFSAVFINAVPFDRLEHKRESLELCADLLHASDRILIMFPEGTRSMTGEIQPFKKGIGILAAGTGTRVVPAYIDGAHAAWPKGSRWPRPARVRVMLGEPLDFSDTPRTDEGIAHVTQTVEAAVRRLQAQRP